MISFKILYNKIKLNFNLLCRYCIDRIDKNGVNIQYITLIWMADDIDTLGKLKIL